MYIFEKYLYFSSFEAGNCVSNWNKKIPPHVSGNNRYAPPPDFFFILF